MLYSDKDNLELLLARLVALEVERRQVLERIKQYLEKWQDYRPAPPQYESFLEHFDKFSVLLSVGAKPKPAVKEETEGNPTS